MAEEFQTLPRYSALNSRGNLPVATKAELGLESSSIGHLLSACVPAPRKRHDVSPPNAIALVFSPSLCYRRLDCTGGGAGP